MKRNTLLILVSLLLFAGIQVTAQETLSVMVSILPQEYFVSRIGGDLVDVEVMVRPGHSPATYEPRASQLRALSKTSLYFRIGVPFENAWMEKIREANPDMMIADTREGINLRPIGAHHHGHDDECDVPPLGLDPHIWLDPILVMTQAQTIYRYLVKLDPTKENIYKENLTGFLLDLEILHEELLEVLQDLTNRNLMVFHPAWGYFSHRYHLHQIPIEIEGKEPGPRQLAEIIDFGRKNQIGVIFVQEQFSQETAKNVASEIGAQVVSINPLSPDYLANLRQIATMIKDSLED